VTYTHTQSRPQLAVLLIVVFVAAMVQAIVVADPVLFLAPAVLAIVAVVAYSFSSITTTVTPEAITAAFRWGAPRRVIPRGQVINAEVVRNKWWYGWGLRWIPGGTMYNVWGLDAVHLELDSKRDFRIGTDDPQGLATAITSTATSA
jgi:hypothetical protein